MYASSDLALTEKSEPALHHVEPGSARGREVEVESRVATKPLANLCGLVSAVVVQNKMHVKIVRNFALQKIEEFSKFLRPMATEALADDATRDSIKGSKKRSRSMADVVALPQPRDGMRVLLPPEHHLCPGSPLPSYRQKGRPAPAV